jgi:hypothetical protein
MLEFHQVKCVFNAWFEMNIVKCCYYCRIQGAMAVLVGYKRKKPTGCGNVNQWETRSANALNVLFPIA